MEQMRCVVERITYQNQENGYTIIKCRVKNYQDLVTVVGSMPEIHVGSVLLVSGFWKIDAKYGRQFQMQSFEETLPATVYGIEKYLGSGLIKGIGPKFAKKIVNKFGEDTLTVIEDSPDELLKIPGIGEVRVARIKKSWADQKEIKNIMLFLQGHDVSTSHATKIYKTYGEKSIDTVTENPYRLADDIWGIGFRTADTIAQKMGYEKEKYARLRSGLIYVLNQFSEEGHCFAVREVLIREGAKILEVDEVLIAAALEQMIADHDVITQRVQKLPEEEPFLAVYLPAFFFAEQGTARRLRAIVDAQGISLQTNMNDLEKRPGVEYDPVQREAIRLASSSKVFILTGGPGTGKTTTTLGIISSFVDSGAKVLLAAPTGRAAKRLSETTGMEARTIHRLLEMKPPEGYQRNEKNPLEGDVLIVDECSMIDILLMYNLLKAVPDTMTLILVGDVDQLPSVGAGNVLRDLIQSECFPVVRLTKIFRQAENSRIITNAHRINAGKMPDLSNGRQSDFFFVEQEEPAEAVKAITALVAKRLPAYYHTRDIQVLTPMQRGEVGAANLNMVLQEAVNPGGDGLRRGGVTYKARDKVMQIRNNYEKEVFNGDIGVVTSVDLEERELKVDYDGRSVSYDAAELDELVLAYAITVHKSQGSEYPIVVFPVMMTHYVMLERNLVYTGITRARKALVLVGTKQALAVAIHRLTAGDRNTLLTQRIRETL